MRSTENCPLRSPVSSCNLGGGRCEISFIELAAFNSAILCISLPPPFAPNSFIATFRVEQIFCNFFVLKNISIFIRAVNKNYEHVMLIFSVKKSIIIILRNIIDLMRCNRKSLYSIMKKNTPNNRCKWSGAEFATPGSRELLPAPSPLRTLRETFTSQGSSIGKACCYTRQLFSFPACVEVVFPYPTLRGAFICRIKRMFLKITALEPLCYPGFTQNHCW